MRHLLLIILLLSQLFVSCSTDDDNDNTEVVRLSFQEKEQQKIKRKGIKTISIFEYHYTFGEVNENGVLHSIIYYDTTGREIKREENFRDDGSVGTKYFHTYDSTGRRISTIDELDINKNQPYTKKVYRYDNVGNISEVVDYYMDGDVAWKSFYIYDENGLLSKLIVDNKLSHEYEYDSEYKLIQSKYYGEFFGERYVEIWHYKYDNGIISEALMYDENGEPYMKRKYVYDYY